MEPTKALVREPGNGYPGCISSHPLHKTVDLNKARAQHSNYCNVISDLGLEVIRIPRDDYYPDSCFVEDNAIVRGDKALICRMASCFVSSMTQAIISNPASLPSLQLSDRRKIA